MGTVFAIFKALSAALGVFKQERAIYNKPEMVKGKLEEQKQAAIDAINEADRVLADPNATPEQHADALRKIRLAHS